MTPARRAVSWWAASAAVLALAAWARVANWRAVRWAGEVLPQVDGDAAYHLHRILETTRRFPDVPTFDPLTNWPRGASCPWSDGFDLAGALLARLVGGARSEAAAHLAAGLLPALLGVAVVWATMRLARRLGADRWAALGAGVGAALLPTLVTSSRFGRVDHHLAEALTVLLLADWVLDPLPAGDARPRAARLRSEAKGALVATLGLYAFSGAALYVAIAAAVLMVTALARRGAAEWLGSGAAALLAAAVLSAALAAPAIAEHRRLLSFQFPSLLQPALLAVASLGVASAVATTRLRPAARWPRRAALLALAALAGSAGAALVFPELLREVGRGLSEWLLRKDPWLSRVREFQPLLRPTGLPPMVGLHLLLGWSGFVAVLALPLATWELSRRDRARARVFAAHAGAFFLLALLQIRFAAIFAPLLAIAVALGFAAIGRRLAEARPRLAGAAGPAVVASLLALHLADPPSRQLLVPARAAGPDPFQAAALDLRRAEPPVPGSGAGVAVEWASGHTIRVLGRRPVATNGFGTYLDAETFWEMDRALRGTPEELEAAMRRHDLGFFVAGPATLKKEDDGTPIADRERPFLDGSINPAFMQDRPLGVVAIGGSGLPASGVPHLAHFLPRFAARHHVVGLRFETAALWTFELVAGARLVGTAAPGARVVAELPLVENGRPHRWRAWGDAGRDGRFAITVPIPTGWSRPTIGAGDAWEVRAGEGEPVRVVVPERAVRAGEELAVGSVPASRDVALRR